MNRQQKKEQRQRQSTRQLMGIDRLTEHGIKTPRGELVFFLVRPDNLSVLSNEGIRKRVHDLNNLLLGAETVRLMALDSRESFQKNKNFYQEQYEREDNPRLRALLMHDKAYLDEIQATTATAREFAFVYELERQPGENVEATLSTMEKNIRDLGFHVHLAGKQDLMRLLAVYYQQDVTTEVFENFDGERVIFDLG